MDNVNKYNNMRFEVKKIVIAVILIWCAIVLCFGSFSVVPAGHTGVITRFGKVSEVVLDEGLHMKIPVITQIISIDNRVLRTDVNADSASKDLQTITSTVSVNYRINRTSSAEVYKNIGRNVEEVILKPAVQECVKSVTSRFTAEELITNRQAVGEQIRVLLEDKIKPFGLNVEVLNVINFNFSDEFNRAIEAKQTAQQQALKAEQDLARIRIEAEQQIAQAQAEAESYKLKSQEITQDMLKLEAIRKWNGELPKTYMREGSGILFNLPIE